VRGGGDAGVEDCARESVAVVENRFCGPRCCWLENVFCNTLLFQGVLVLSSVADSCSVLQMLQSVAECCSEVQWVAVSCSELQCSGLVQYCELL